MFMDIKLDKKTFKALSNDTRIEILKLLHGRRHTQSELAEVLGLSIPTVKEHLNELSSSGLVELNEEGRKWKYYSLTNKGKGVLNPEELKIWILLGLLVFSAVGGFVSYTPAPVVERMALSAEADVSMLALPQAAVVGPNVALYVFVGASLLFAVVLLFFFFRNSRFRRLGKNLNKKRDI